MRILNEILSSLDEKYTFFREPFDHIICDDFLSKKLFDEICDEMPKECGFHHYSKIGKGRNALWLKYLEAINHIEFYHKLIHKFRLNILLTSENTGVRGFGEDVTYVTASYACIRKPLNTMGWLLNPHIDSEYAILSGVHYFNFKIKSQGQGSLGLLKKKTEEVRYLEGESIIQYADPAGFDIVKEIEYRPNRVVIFPKYLNSWHGILQWDKGLRRSVNISLEFQNNGLRKKHSL